MPKFKTAAKLAIAFQENQPSNKLIKFDMLKSNLKERRESISAKPGDLNSKYEQDEQLENDLQRLYNVRYEMSDDEFDRCESGLDMIGEESENSEEEEAEESDETIEETKREDKNKVPEEDEQSEDANISIDSDLEDILKERVKSQLGNEDEDSLSEGFTEDDGDTDEELENVIETDEDEYDQGDEESAGNWEEDINYSDLEEEEDSDAFSFTGLSVAETESKFSSEFGRRSEISSRRGRGSKLSRKKSRIKSMSRHTTPDINDEIFHDEKHEETIMEETAPEVENEKILSPDITYSRSVSIIEEYESDVFDFDDNSITVDGEISGELTVSDGDSQFSIPRVNTIAENNDDYSEKFIAEMLEEIMESLELREDSNKRKSEDDNEETEFEGEMVEDKKAISENEAFLIGNESVNEGLGDNSAAEEASIIINGDSKEPCSSSLSETYTKMDKTQMRFETSYKVENTYQKHRGKEKKLFSWKKRTEIFARSRNKKYRNKSRTSPMPDSEIPSYKAKIETADFIINNLLSMVEETAENNRKERQRPIYEMANRIIEDVLDMWECKVDERTMIREEQTLESLATDVVSASLMVSIRDIAGNETYFGKYFKEPKFKEISESETKVASRKTRRLLTKKERYAKRGIMRKERNREDNESVEKVENREEERKNKVDTTKETKTKEARNKNRQKKSVKKTDLDQGNIDNNDLQDNDDKYCKSKKSSKQKENNAYDLVDKHGNNSLDDINAEEKKYFVENEENVDILEDHKENKIKTKTNKLIDEESSVAEYKATILQGMDDLSNDIYQGDSKDILKSLPKANKKDYCMQWLMRTVPSPPNDVQSDRRKPVAGRQRRYKKRKEFGSERGRDSVLSEDSKYTSESYINMKDLLIENERQNSRTQSKMSGIESEVSVPNTGRESCVSFRTASSCSSYASRKSILKKELISKEAKEDIQKFYDGILQKRIAERDEKFRLREMGEGRRSGCDKDSRDSPHLKKGYNEDDAGDSAARNSEESASVPDVISRVNEELNPEGHENEIVEQDLLQDNEETELQFKDDAESQTSQETIWPTESPFFVDDSNRFQTPASEPEEDTDNQKSGRKKKTKKWSWQGTTNLIRWTNVKPVIKPGVTMDYYRKVNLKIKKAIFDSLSLRRPTTLSDLKNKPRLLALSREEVQEINLTANTPRRKNASCCSLPPVSLQNGMVREYKDRESLYKFQKERASLPAIVHNLNKNASVPKKSKTGAWN